MDERMNNQERRRRWAIAIVSHDLETLFEQEVYCIVPQRTKAYKNALKIWREHPEAQEFEVRRLDLYIDIKN